MSRDRQQRPKRGRALRVVAILGTVGGVVAGTLAAAPAGAATPGTLALAASQPGWVATAVDKGASAASSAVDFDVVMTLRNAAAANSTLTAVSTPGSKSYHSFLTTAQFRASYSPTAASVAAVEKWVGSAGLKVASVSSTNMYVEVTGTAAQAARLLKTSLRNYGYQGQILQAPSTNLSIPRSLAGTVTGITGLGSVPAITNHTGGNASAAATAAAAITPAAAASAPAGPTKVLPGPPAGARYGVQPCSAYYGQKIATDKPSAYGSKAPYTICGYGSKQYEGAYGLTSAIASGNDGSGVTVAIDDAYAAPTIEKDTDIFSAQNGIPVLKPGQLTQVLPKIYDDIKLCGPQGWYGEETLDVEAVHSMAPGAKIVYVGGRDCAGGLDNAFATVIDDHLASVETDSWLEGVPDSDLPAADHSFFYQELLEAGLTGVSVLFSSGDEGDSTVYGVGRFASEPADNPLATGVGGTSTEIGAANNIEVQTGWSNAYSQLVDGAWTPTPPGNYSSGSGGGQSGHWPEPAYQKGVVPNSVATYGGTMRASRSVPDISMPGDPNTGLRIGETQTFPDGTYYSTFRLGGTSLASPLLAGFLADTVQATGSALGFINPTIYAKSGSAGISDVTSVSKVATVRTNFVDGLNSADGLSFELQTLDVPTTINTAVGYDDMTGVGTPKGPAFYTDFE